MHVFQVTTYKAIAVAIAVVARYVTKDHCVNIVRKLNAEPGTEDNLHIILTDYYGSLLIHSLLVHCLRLHMPHNLLHKL